MNNEQLVTIRDTRSLEERLATTISLAMAQIANEREQAKKEMQIMERIWRQS